MRTKDFKPPNQRFEVTVEHAGLSLTASPAEEANQQSSSLPASSSTSTSAPQAEIPKPAVIPHCPGFQMPPGLQPLHLHHAQQPEPSQPQQQPQQSEQQPVQARRRTYKEIKTKRLNRGCSSAYIKENHLSITQDQINADHQRAQSEEELLQGLILQEWCEGDLQGCSADQIKAAITKELRQIGPRGHDAYDSVPLSSLSHEES